MYGSAFELVDPTLLLESFEKLGLIGTVCRSGGVCIGLRRVCFLIMASYFLARIFNSWL